MTNQQQLAIRCACADLIDVMETRNKTDNQNYDWNAHILTINELIKAYPFLIPEFKPKLKRLI